MALEDTLNKSIAELAQEYIFSPLGMKNTTMIQPNEKDFYQM
jgi:CubicO group peptidase (beta-lactamase class C family)